MLPSGAVHGVGSSQCFIFLHVAPTCRARLLCIIGLDLCPKQNYILCIINSTIYVIQTDVKFQIATIEISSILKKWNPQRKKEEEGISRG